MLGFRKHKSIDIRSLLQQKDRAFSCIGATLAHAIHRGSPGSGVSAKLEAELYLSGVGISPDGIFLGTYAIGLYVEGAVRRLHDDVSDLQLGVGLTIRTPMVWTW